MPVYLHEFFIYLAGGSEHTLFHQLAHSWHNPNISCNNTNYWCQKQHESLQDILQ